MAAGRRGLANSGEAGGALSRGRGGGGSRGVLGLDLGTGLVGRCSRRWCSVAHRGGGRCCLSCAEVRAGEKRERGSVVSLGARARGVANWLGIGSRLGLAAAGTQCVGGGSV
jgi:hypothetical protein